MTFQQPPRVRERMTRLVHCVLPGDAIADVHALMRDFGIRHLPVVESGRLVGLISDRDVLVRARLEAGKLTFPEPLTAERIMTRDVVTCRDGTPLAEVAGRMVSQRIDCLPVTDDGGRLVGLVTTTDLLEVLRDRAQMAADEPLPFDFKFRGDPDLPESVI